MELNEMRLVRCFDLRNQNVYYQNDNLTNLHFDRIGYKIELVSPVFGHQYLILTCNPFTTRIETLYTPGEYDHVQLDNVYLLSNVMFFNNIEHCHAKFSIGDYQITGTNDFGRNGCFQLFANNVCLFAYNDFNGNTISSVGIGNNNYGSVDWAITHNSNIYNVASMSIFIKPTKASVFGLPPRLTLQYSFDIPSFQSITYNFHPDSVKSSTLPFDKVFYYLQLDDLYGQSKWVLTSFSAFSSEIKHYSIPKMDNITADVQNICVNSNILGNIFYKQGKVHFSPYNYGPNNLGLDKTVFQWGDYGCFQLLANNDIIFAYNNFKQIPDIGIGNNLCGHRDYTFSSNGHHFNFKKFEIYTQPCIACFYVHETHKLRLLASGELGCEFEVNNEKNIIRSSFTKISYFIFLQHPIDGIFWLYISFNVDNTDSTFFLQNNFSMHIDNPIITSNLPFNECISSLTFEKNGRNMCFQNVFCYDDLNQVVHFDTVRNINEYSSKHVQIFTNNVEFKPDFIIALVGQSNSQGWGGKYDRNVEADQIHKNITTWNIEDKRWQIADLRQTMGTKPANLQCLAFHFAKEFVKENPDKNVGIIIYGFVGQSISNWTIPNVTLPKARCSWKNDTAFIYDNTIIEITEALQVANKQTLDLILWHQGEADSDESFEYYETRLKQIIHQFRTEPFGITRLPFIVGEIKEKYGFWHKQNKILKSLNSDIDKFTRCASSKNLDTDKSSHFTSEAHRILGTRYYEQYKIVTRWGHSIVQNKI
jgi:hypothetical protein